VLLSAAWGLSVVAYRLGGRCFVLSLVDAAGESAQPMGLGGALRRIWAVNRARAQARRKVIWSLSDHVAAPGPGVGTADDRVLVR
jgi:hypothetical protein